MLTSWETHHPRPVIPASVGNPKEPGRMCTVSGSSIRYFHRCLPLAPQPHPLSNPMLLKVPQTSQAFSFPPAALLASPLSPQFSVALGRAGRTPLMCTSILESPGSLLLGSSHRFLRLWRKTRAGDAGICSVRIADSEP